MAAPLSDVVLLPCPFCGGSPRFWTSPYGRTVACEACKFEISRKESKTSSPHNESAVVKVWNTRSTVVPGIFKLVEGLKPVDASSLAEYEREMTEDAIPAIIKDVEKRRILAAESRQRSFEMSTTDKPEGL